MPFVDGGLADRVVEFADTFASADAEGHRRVGWSKGRRADLGNGHTQRLGQNRHAIDIAQFALVGTETQCGVAFDMFDVAITFADGQPDIGDTCVVLEIEELLGTAVRIQCRWDKPQRFQRLNGLRRDRRNGDVGHVEACFRERVLAGPGAVFQAVP